jgi:hypothetical protein
MIDVYSEHLTKYINAVCGQKAEDFNIRASGRCNNHVALKG